MAHELMSIRQKSTKLNKGYIKKIFKLDSLQYIM